MHCPETLSYGDEALPFPRKANILYICLWTQAVTMCMRLMTGRASLSKPREMLVSGLPNAASINPVYDVVSVPFLHGLGLAVTSCLEV